MKILDIDIKKENELKSIKELKKLSFIGDVDIVQRFIDNAEMIELILIKRKWHFEGFINGKKVYSKGQQRIGIGNSEGDIGWNPKFKSHKPVVKVNGSKKWVGLIAR